MKPAYALTAGLSLVAALVACRKNHTAGAPAPPAGAPPIVESTRWPHVGSDLPPDPAATWGALDNGLRFVILPNPEPPGRVSLRLYIDVGSLHETDEQQGLAHFMEHMAFNGTKNFPADQLVEYFQRLGMGFGADTNAHTSFRETVYTLEIPPGPGGTLPEEHTLTDGLRMLRDVGDGLLLDAKEIEKERGIILSEKLARDTVEFRTMLEELKFELPDSKVSSRMPIGTEEVIAQAPRERFVDFYEKFYTPDRMVLVVVGAVDPPTMKLRIAEVLGAMVKRERTPDPEFGSATVGRGISTKVHVEKESGYATASFSVSRTYQPKPDTAAARIDELKKELASRMVGRRLEILAKEKDSPLLSGQVQIRPFLQLIDLAQLEVAAPPPRWADAVALGARELRKARKYGFTKSEFNQAKADVVAELENGAKSAPTRKSKDLANEIVAALAAGRVFVTPADELARARVALETLTPDDCHKVFEEAFGSKDLTVFASGNLPPAPNGESLEAALQRGMGEAIEPPREETEAVFAYADFGAVGEVAESKDVADVGITQVVFKNGVRLNLKPTDFKKDEVLVQVSFGTGKLSLPKEQPGLELYTRSIFQLGGLSKHSVDDLQRVLAGQTVSADFDVGEDSFAFAGTTTREDFKRQLQLLCAYLVDPGWREEGDRMFRQGAEAIFAQVEHTLDGQLQARVAPYLHGNDHRFAFPSKDQALARTVDEAKTWLGPALAQAPVEVGLVGDFDPKEALDAVARTFGAISARSTAATPKPGPLAFPPPGRQDFVYQTKIAKAVVLAHFPTTDRSDIRKTRRLQVLAAVFGDELRAKIREELGESYSPRASASASDVFPGYGSLFASVLVSPSQSGKVSAAVVEIARRIAAEGVGADALERAIKPLLTAIEEQRRSNAYWLTTVCASCQRDPRRLEWARSMVGDFKAVTTADLTALAKQYLAPSAIREVRVLPAE